MRRIRRLDFAKDLSGNNRIGWSEADIFLVMAGEGPPSTTCSVGLSKVVGGRPAPAMMVSRDQVGIGVLISRTGPNRSEGDGGWYAELSTDTRAGVDHSMNLAQPALYAGYFGACFGGLKR